MEQANSIDEFQNKIERYKKYSPNVFYRGQSEKYQNITTSLSRDAGYVKNESAIFREAIQLGDFEFEGLSEPIEFLSKMQHYGVPTRLVDMSLDPLVALFFAVEKTESPDSGNVYVFLQSPQSLHSKQVKVIALLATLDSYEIDAIKETFLCSYGEEISTKEICEYACECAFIERTDELRNLNERLFRQKGTFAICGNNVKDKKITQSILPLDAIDPALVIRIPYVYKLTIKKELDEKYNINETTIYPEFPSVSDYLKQKYKSYNFDPQNKYNIIEAKEVIIYGIKKVSVIFVLTSPLRIEEVKALCTMLIKEYAKFNDIVWIYAARTAEDYITKNWVLRGQWFKKGLNSKFTPRSIGTLDENNCSWSYEKAFSVLSDFHSEYIFRDDKTLYICNMKKYREVEVCYELILSTFNGGDMKSIQQRVRECKETIQGTVSYLDNLGRSRDIERDKFFDKFSDFANYLDDLVFQVEREGIEDCLKREIAVKCINDTKKKKIEIDANADRWKMIIGVNDFEYEEFDPSQIKKKEYQYKQTLPINADALVVRIELEIQQNDDRTISISGTTNLFDLACLMITIRSLDGYTTGGNMAFIRNGKIDFGRFTNKGEGYATGTYKADASLSLPDLQSPDFVRLAGREYENLTGALVKREGIGPVVSYTQQFSVV